MAEILHKDLLGDDIHELRVTISSNPPAAVPLFVGQGFYDIVSKKFYVAQGTSLVTDWVTTPIPPFLAFADTTTITWTSNQVGDEVTYQANVDEANLVLTSTNITDFDTAVLTLPQIISLINDQHTRLIMRTGSEPGGWAPVIQDGLELDPSAQKIKLSQNLSESGDPQFDEVTLITRAKTPLLTLTTDGVPTAASAFLNNTKGVVIRGNASSTSSFTLQNEVGVDVLSNPVNSNQLVAPSLAMGTGNGPGVVHATDGGLLSASKLIDADVAAAAAIAGTKIDPDFGSQGITTTGTLFIDKIDSNNDILTILGGTNNKTVNIATDIGYNTVNIGGTNSTVNIYGASYVTPVDYVSEDKNILVNFNASGQDSQDSGIYVQEEYAGALINLNAVAWQSGTTVRYSVDSLGSGVNGLVVGEFVRITGFLDNANNGTYKVLAVASAYIDVINPERTNASKDEANPGFAARLLLAGYIHVGSTRTSWELKAPARSGIFELRPAIAAKFLLITTDSVNDVTVKFNTNLTVDQDLQKSASVEFSNLKLSSLTTGIAHLNATGNVSSSLIVDEDVSGTAAIAGTKINPDFGSQDITTTGDASIKSLMVTGADTAGGSNLFQDPDQGLVIRGIFGDTNEFRLINSLGSPLISITTTGETTLHDLSANNGVVKATGGVLSSGFLIDADVGAAASIAGTKINPNFGSQNVVTLGNVSGGGLTTTGLSSLGGGQKVKLSSLITSNYVATTSDYILRVDTTGGTVTITLPSAATVGAGTVIIVKDASGAAVTNNITVAPNGADTIDGGTYSIIDTYASVTFVSDGTNKWLVI